MNLLLQALAILIVSGVIAIAAFRWPRFAASCGAMGTVVASVLGLVSATETLRRGTSYQEKLSWAAPYGELALGIDPLSAFFLFPLLALASLAAVYGGAYLLGHGKRESVGPATFFFNLLVASMVLVLIARDGLILLVAWEVMTLSSYLLVTLEHAKAEVRRAGWVYLIAGHIGVAFLILLFLLLSRQTGSIELQAFRQMHGPGPAFELLIFMLALLGFGVKAGLVPLHVWLPEAHAAAPSHVSALMSGILIKLGLYGILRVLSFLPLSAWWGPTFIVLGFIGGLWGISQALYQRDLKRVLAYSSIENVGLIMLGIGIGFCGASLGRPRLAALGLLGGLFHLWNHVAMKGLLFFSAGSVLHGAGTKDLEALGGLIKRMPRTALALLIGAVAIAGLPPLNGFVSKWFLYLGLSEGGLKRQDAIGTAALLSIGALALIGGMTALCFSRLVGMALLGNARSDAARQAHESPLLMTVPMSILAGIAVGIAIVPQIVLLPISQVAGQIIGPARLTGFASLQSSLASLTLSSAVVWMALGILGVLLFALTRRRAADETWGCGYAAPSIRMQYTASSFAQFWAERLLPKPLGPRISQVRIGTSLFPGPTRLSIERADPLTRGVYEPFFTRWASRFARLRWLQQGLLHVYLVYILVVVVVGLAWLSLRSWLGS